MSVGAAVFLASTGAAVYILFLYPLLLRFWPGRPAGDITPRLPGDLPSVSVILAVRNGEQWIRRKLESIAGLDYDETKMQVIVASDGSTDGTERAVREFTARPIELLVLPPGGKASAINAALERATNDILFFTDVRQDLDPAALKELVRLFEDPQVGVASGELIIRSGDTVEERNVGLYWEYEKWFRKQHSRIDSVMGATGAIYAMRRRLARPLPPFTILDDVYLPMAAFFQGYRILFSDRALAYDVPTALDSEFRRKVRTQAGVYQLLGQYPELLGPRNRMWIHFVSHKLGRLLLPFLLIAIAVSSAFLSPAAATAAIAAQAVFYGLALLDPVLPRPLKPVSSVIRTFVVLLAAALVAASILFRSAESFWRPSAR